MNRDAIREALLPHAKRPVRAFLRGKSITAESAFWDLVYDRTPDITHEVAEAVAAELEQSPRTVGELLGGWRPRALSAKEVRH